MKGKLNVLVVGRSGQVATELVRRLDSSGHRVEAMGRPDLDLADLSGVETVLQRIRPDLVVNAGAYTAVDKAEDEPEVAIAANGTGPRVLAAAAHRSGIPIVHFSTDYVFDGTSTTPYREDDPTSPLGSYGNSKLIGERYVAAANPRHVILRTAWVYSPFGQNFLKTMLRLGAERPNISVVDDQIGCPTSAASLAAVVDAIAPDIFAADVGSQRFGVFHAVSRDNTSWCGFARAIMDGAEKRGAKVASVNAITTAQYPTKARRPAYSVLDAKKLEMVYGLQMPDWRSSLDACLDEMLGAAAAGSRSIEVCKS